MAVSASAVQQDYHLLPSPSSHEGIMQMRGAWQRNWNGMLSHAAAQDAWAAAQGMSGVSSDPSRKRPFIEFTNMKGPIAEVQSEPWYNMFSDIAYQNNAQAALAAQNANDYNTRMTQAAMEYNAAEAAKARDWQEYMSNTAHQREVADLKAAGLNPVLSASGGNGAYVGSGATASASAGSSHQAQTDMQSMPALVNILASMLSAQTALANTATSAANNLAVAEKYNATSLLTGQMAHDAAVSAAGINAGAAKYSADQVALWQLAGQQMQWEIAGLNNDQQMARLLASNDFQEYITKNYPNNPYQAVSDILHVLFPNIGNTSIDNLKKDPNWSKISSFLNADILDLILKGEINNYGRSNGSFGSGGGIRGPR